FNKRTFQFVRVSGGVELPPLASNDVGTGSSSISSTTDIGSGTYRLHYDHTDKFLFDPGKDNATNLNIAFTFKSEGGSGGGVVPEPSSVAVFGLLSLGSAVAKWRRKRSQLAA
ncbi:MAG: PEP-CTERM sorting domain-containing protein, partial [Pirellula sp.]